MLLCAFSLIIFENNRQDLILHQNSRNIDKVQKFIYSLTL